MKMAILPSHSALPSESLRPLAGIGNKLLFFIFEYRNARLHSPSKLTGGCLMAGGQGYISHSV